MKDDGTPIREALLETLPILNRHLGEVEVKELRTFVEAHLDDGKPTAMVYGIYNSGKSTLLNALRGRKEAKTANRPETDRVTPYNWKGLQILDTPGIDAPQEHEKVSREALDKTDAVLFVMDSSSTYEEAAIYDEITDILERNKRLMIVVNNKSGLSETDEEYGRIYDKILANIQAAAERRDLSLGRATPPIRMVDAKTGLKGRVEDEYRLVAASGLIELEADLNRMLGAAGFHDVVNTVGQRLLDGIDRAIAKVLPSDADDEAARLLAAGEAKLRHEKTRAENAIIEELRGAIVRFQRTVGGYDDRQQQELRRSCTDFRFSVESAIERELTAASEKYAAVVARLPDSSSAIGATTEEVAADAPGQTAKHRAEPQDAGAELGRVLVSGARMVLAKNMPKSIPYIAVISEVYEVGSAIRRQRSKHAQEEEIRRDIMRWTDYVANSADRMEDAAKMDVRKSVDAAFAPAEAVQRAGREKLAERDRKLAEDHETLNACRERVKRHLDALLSH